MSYGIDRVILWEDDSPRRKLRIRYEPNFTGGPVIQKPHEKFVEDLDRFGIFRSGDEEKRSTRFDKRPDGGRLFRREGEVRLTDYQEIEETEILNVIGIEPGDRTAGRDCLEGIPTRAIETEGDAGKRS
jgi:hypothetical protein